MQKVFLFMRIEIIPHLECAKVESHVIGINDRFLAMQHIAMKHKYQEDKNELLTFLSGLYNRIIHTMNPDDKRLATLESQHGLRYWTCLPHERYSLSKPAIGLHEILQIGIDTQVITEPILEKYIFKSSENVSYKLDLVDIENSKENIDLKT
jgi:hypothetical protein